MGLLWTIAAGLGAWLLVAVALALLIGRAARIGEAKHQDELFLRDLARESARVAHELNDGVVQELTLIRSAGAALAHVAPEADTIVRAADRALAEAGAAMRALDRFR